jgi:hypothetical protein
MRNEPNNTHIHLTHPTCTKHHKATRLVQPFRVGTVEIEEVDVTHAVEQPI